MRIFTIIMVSLLTNFSFAFNLTKLNAAWLHKNEKAITSQLQASEKGSERATL